MDFSLRTQVTHLSRISNIESCVKDLSCVFNSAILLHPSSQDQLEFYLPKKSTLLNFLFRISPGHIVSMPGY